MIEDERVDLAGHVALLEVLGADPSRQGVPEALFRTVAEFGERGSELACELRVDLDERLGVRPAEIEVVQLDEAGQLWDGRRVVVDPEVDRLQRIRLTAIDPEDNKQATIDLLRRMAEQIGAVPLIYSVEVILARNKVKGPIGNYGPQEGITWNIFEWEVTERL